MIKFWGEFKMRIQILLMIFLFLAPSVHAQETFGKEAASQTEPRIREDQGRGRLMKEDLERVRTFKELIRDVDVKSLEQTIHEIEIASYPELELQMREAIAKTYADIVREQKGIDQAQKEWLYSMVTINMAYLQFGGKQDDSGTALNMIIRKKLREYLPSDVFTHPGFLQKLE
jgi:hypothetical protein